MLRKGESQLKVSREDPQKQHFRTSWVRPSGPAFHNIPQIKWVCPPQFMVDPDWKMEDGSESQEIHIQLQRELRTAEAFYIFNSNIPPNPSVASDALDFNGDDSRVPIIPLDVIDNETSSEDDGTSLITLSPGVKVGEITTQPLTIPPLTPQVNRTPEVGKQPLLQRDEVIAAAVALIALIKFKEPGNQIDLELLIQLLRNPGMLEHLMKEYGPSVNQRSVTICGQPHERASVPLPVPSPASVHHPAATGTAPLSVKVTVNSPKVPVDGYNTWSPSVPFTNSMSSEVKNTIYQIRKPEGHGNSSKPLATMISGPGPNSPTLDMAKIRKLINEHGLPSGGETLRPENLSARSGPRSVPVVMKDSEYYRKLVSQHGMAQESPNPQGFVKLIGTIPIESKPQEQRPCVYYNSDKGCRRGSSCWFPHVKVNLEGGSRAAQELQGAKRTKLSGGNFARHTCHWMD